MILDVMFTAMFIGLGMWLWKRDESAAVIVWVFALFVAVIEMIGILAFLRLM